MIKSTISASGRYGEIILHLYKTSVSLLPPSDDSWENYRVSICQTMRLLLREWRFLLNTLLLEIVLQCNLLFSFSNPDHILEHSEDDTKSLFVIIKVADLFFVCHNNHKGCQTH